MSWYFGYWCGTLINYINLSQMACLVHQYLHDAPVVFLRRHLHFCIFLEIYQHPHSFMQISEPLHKLVFISQFWNAIWMGTMYFATYSLKNHKLVNVVITWKLLSKYIHSIFTYKNNVIWLWYYILGTFYMPINKYYNLATSKVYKM